VRFAYKWLRSTTIQNALRRIRPSIGVSPAAQSHELSRIAGGPVFLKLENLQRMGSFKERGALNRLLTLTAEERDRGLVTASAGNHAQAVAYHAGRIGVKSQIWMPLPTPLAKVFATRKHGAEVVLHGTSFDEVYTAARESCCRARRTFVHPFDDEHLIAGQGTIGPEILEQLPQLDAAIVPVGGGGLISGVAVALKELRRRIRVIGVQTSSLPSMSAALQAKVPVLLPAASTIADGIAVRSAGEKTVPLVQKYVDDLVLVDEEESRTRCCSCWSREKNVAEGAGAVGVAALLTPRLISMVKRRLSWCRVAMWMSRS
jgi:threonine dehydratase